MEADRVVVELIAKVDGFDGKVAQSASGFDASMKRIETAATKAEATVARSSDARAASIRKESAQISSAAKLLGTQINDIGHLMNGPNSPFVIPAKQAPVVSKAFTALASGAAALGGVIGGVLVSAVIAYAASLAEMILQQKDAGEEINELIEKLQEQARKAKLADAAQLAFSMTLEGVTQALNDNEKALEGLSQEQESAAYTALKQANLAKITLQDIRDRTEATLDEAKAQIELNRARVQFADKPGLRTALTGEADAAAKRVEELQRKLAGIDKQAARAADQHSKALAALAVEIGSRDPVEQIRTSYDRLVDATAKRLRAEGKTADEILRQTKALREQQRIEEEAARKRGKIASDPKLPKVTQAEIKSLVKEVFGAGTQISSGTRTAAQNKRAGGSANSYHLSGQALDFVPQGGMAAFDREMLRLAAEARGIKVLELLGPGDKGHNDHGHIAFSRTRLGGDQVAEARERQAARLAAAAEAEERRVQAFQNEQAGLEGQLIDARQALITSAEEIAQLELAAIEISRQKYADNLASLVEQKKLLPQEAAELAKLNEERAKLRAELVARREAERKFRLAEADAQQRLAVDNENRNAQQELLQGQLQLAKTQQERRALETRLLELQYQEEKARNDYLIGYAERLRLQEGITESELREAEAAAELARIRNDTLAQRQEQDQQKVEQGTQGPLVSFFGDIPSDAAEINEALESIAAGGLASITDGLTDAIMGFRSFGDVGKAVLQQVAAGIIKLGIQQLLLATIGKMLGSTATAATAAQAGAAAAAWAPAAAAASLATLGANAGPAAAALASTHALSAALSIPKGFRSGGYTGNGGVNEAAGIVHGKEFVFDADSTRRIGPSNLEAMRRGVTPSNGVAVPPRGAGGGSFSKEDISQLRSVIGEAIQAMPEIGVYPTLDPVDVLERALASPRGSKAFIAHIGSNSGAVNGALQR
jgi:uncharacterized protein YcbK (DUF882 family)